jgi:hypothetical protein
MQRTALTANVCRARPSGSAAKDPRVPWAAALCVLLLVSDHRAETVQMKLSTIQQGDLSEIQERREVVVRNAAEWAALWKQHRPGEPLPAFDFTRSMIAGVFLGSRPTGGHTIEVTSVQREGPNLVVSYRESRPDPQMMVTQMLTSPFHLVRIDRPEGTVLFRRLAPPAGRGKERP